MKTRLLNATLSPRPSPSPWGGITPRSRPAELAAAPAFLRKGCFPLPPLAACLHKCALLARPLMPGQPGCGRCIQEDGARLLVPEEVCARGLGMLQLWGGGGRARGWFAAGGSVSLRGKGAGGGLHWGSLCAQRGQRCLSAICVALPPQGARAEERQGQLEPLLAAPLPLLWGSRCQPLPAAHPSQ